MTAITPDDEPRPNCPDCGVPPGEKHTDACLVAICPQTGRMRPCPASGPQHRCGASVWSGLWPGAAECAELGWFSRWDPETKTNVSCSPQEPGAMPDLNRLHREARWNPRSRRFELPPARIRTPAETTDEPADESLPDHGTAARARGRWYANIPPCHCPPCRAALASYRKRLAADRQLGRPRRLPAGPIARHVRKLNQLGMTLPSIAASAPCSRSVLLRLLDGSQPSVSTAVAGRILAVSPQLDSTASIGALGAARRIQALMSAGHTLKAISRKSGVSKDVLSGLALGERKRLRAGTFQKIDAAYRALADTPAAPGAPATRARNQAAAYGWFAPDAWQGEIDNPRANPARWRRLDAAPASTEPERRVAA